MSTFLRWTLTALTALTALALVVATAVPSAAAIAIWQWTVCTPGAEKVAVEIENQNGQGYRFRVRHWFYDGAVLDRSVTRDPWVPAHTEKVFYDTAEADDNTIRTKVVRGHYEYPGGWQTWVTDENLLDVTVEGCGA